MFRRGGVISFNTPPIWGRVPPGVVLIDCNRLQQSDGRKLSRQMLFSFLLNTNQGYIFSLLIAIADSVNSQPCSPSMLKASSIRLPCSSSSVLSTASLPIESIFSAVVLTILYSHFVMAWKLEQKTRISESQCGATENRYGGAHPSCKLFFL